MALTLIVGCKKEPEVKDEPSVDVVGTWIYGTRDGDDAEYISFTFNADKTASLQECKNRNTNDFSYEISYAVKGSTITISASKGREWKYTAELKDEKLVLTQVGDATWLEEFSDLKEITLDRYYIISFNSNGGSSVKALTVKSGGTASKPTTDPTPSNANHYVFEFWTKEGETTEFDFANTAITADTTLVAKWKNRYKVGDTGPAGGKIFYVVPDSEGTKTSVWGSDSLTWKYLEAAPEDLSSTYQWGYGTSCLGSLGTKTGIGDGWGNNITLDNDNFAAAKACRDYRNNNNYDDWFLPSKDELAEMYAKRTEIGRFDSTGLYWSSSESTDMNTYAIGFNDGETQEKDRTSDSVVLKVRPIRAF